MKRTIITSLLVTGVLSLSLPLAAGGTKDAGSSSVSKGAELVIDNEAEPQSLDPTQIQGIPENRIYMALFEGLVDYDPKTNHAVPGIAESWERSDNDTVLTFHLRKTTWSDGTPITAQTFVDSWLYYLSPKVAAEYAYMPAMIIKGAEAYKMQENQRLRQSELKHLTTIPFRYSLSVRFRMQSI
jgi:oligopeptide transport system substrate-binding protein